MQLKDLLNPDAVFGFLKRINMPRRREKARNEQGLAYAGLSLRLLAAALDAGIIAFILTPFNPLILAYAYSGVHWDPDAWQQTTTEGAQAWRTQLQLIADSGLPRAFGRLCQVQFAVMAAYSFGFWHFVGATPGKWFLRLRVVDAATGAPISDKQSMLRIIGYVLSGLPLGAGIFAMDWNRKHQAWHDKFAQTAVVILPWKKPKNEPHA